MYVRVRVSRVAFKQHGDEPDTFDCVSQECVNELCTFDHFGEKQRRELAAYIVSTYIHTYTPTPGNYTRNHATPSESCRLSPWPMRTAAPHTKGPE